MLQLGMRNSGPQLAAFVFIAMPLSVFAQALKPPVFGAHYGYTADVKEERDRREIEMVLLDTPPEPPAPKQVLVNEKLSKEFQDQYRYRFGQTQTEQVLNSPSRDESYTYFTGENLTIKEYIKYQRQFAEYMGRRLTEYHVDNWAQHDPQFRPVYQLKDRVGHFDLAVRKDYNFKWKYNFAGPNMEVTVENPYKVDFKIRMEMSGIISKPNEFIYTAGYAVNPRITVSGIYKQTDGLYQLVVSRRMNRHIITSITGSLDTLPAGPTVQQNLLLVGFSWSE